MVTVAHGGALFIPYGWLASFCQYTLTPTRHRLPLRHFPLGRRGVTLHLFGGHHNFFFERHLSTFFGRLKIVSPHFLSAKKFRRRRRHYALPSTFSGGPRNVDGRTPLQWVSCVCSSSSSSLCTSLAALTRIVAEPATSSFDRTSNVEFRW